MANNDKINSNTAPFGQYSNFILAFGLMAVLATLIIPLPSFILDLFLAGSISLSIGVLIMTLSSKEALELSTFPSLLLFITLFRLSLNVASTRLILLKGDAGKIIETFGGFVAGGSFVVGRGFRDLFDRVQWWLVIRQMEPEMRKTAWQLQSMDMERRRLRGQLASLAVARKMLGVWHTVHIPIGMALFTAAFVHIIGAIYYATLLR